MLFAAAAMIAAMTVNATVIFDITDDSGKAWADAGTKTNVSFTEEKQDDGVTFKDYKVMAAVKDAGAGILEATLSNGNLAVTYACQSSAKSSFKVYDSYIQPEGDGRVFTISGLTAGDNVNITVPANSATGTWTVEGAEETSVTVDANDKVYTVKATASVVKLTNAGKIRISKIETGAATAANDAEADAEFAYSVKINGQKVNAKVYNEPVIEVSSNGAAKVVINKK